ncbi:alpha/beta family hydrolase [Microbacterium sp. P06]|uniref:alpha/beta hydrolase family protein n=1 Tax=Microbacterium sp. P06 TaxID=3366949 RepID=UPI003745194A
MSDRPLVVDLPAGAVEVSAAWHRPDDAWATVAVAHGAGAGYRHPFLEGFSGALTDAGVATLRFNFPYVEAGRRMPGPAGHAIATWRAVFEWLTDAAAPGPIWASGKSYGGRMASMAAAQGAIAPAGLAYLGYPLHPPGDPTRTRTAHLPDIDAPQLFVSGTNDPFVDPHAQLEQAVASCPDAALRWVEGGGHSFEVKGRKRPADEVGAGIAPLIVEFLRHRSADGNRSGD